MTAIAIDAPRRRRRRPIGHHVRVVSGVVIAVLFLFPILWMVMTSFKNQVDIFTDPPKFFFTPTLDTYIEYMHRTDFIQRFMNTVIVATGSALLSVSVGALSGYALARIKLRGAKTIGLIALLSRGVPPISMAVPMFLVARRLGLTDKDITLIFAYSTFLIPYVMWLMRSFFVSLPPELEESAMIDGCSRFGAFFKIIVPISLPGLISTFIFGMILAWEELLFAIILTNRNATTLPVTIAGISADTVHGANWGALTAVGTMAVVPVVIFALLVQKWLIQGLVEGATKG